MFLTTNLWHSVHSQGGIFRDEESYDQPHVFDPDRFLRSEFGTKKGANNIGRRHTIVFGSGRVCASGLCGL